MNNVKLITDHVGPATVAHWQDQDITDDEASVQNFKTVLAYGRGLSFGTVVDYTKDAYAARVLDEDPESLPNWSAVATHIDRMKHGRVDRTCDVCPNPAFDTYDGTLCRQHFLETVGSAWVEKFDQIGLNSRNMEAYIL